MPVGANDFSLDWYSYDEVPNDFDLKILVFLGILRILSRSLKARCNISLTSGFGPQRGVLQSG